MAVLDAPALASATYRASIEGGGEAELHLSLAPSSATVADAWARLSGMCAARDIFFFHSTDERVKERSHPSLPADNLGFGLRS